MQQDLNFIDNDVPKNVINVNINNFNYPQEQAAMPEPIAEEKN